jgi:DHA1 family tetracycline resistance protein-like MFS transporter
MNQEPIIENTTRATKEKFLTTPLLIIFLTIFIDLVGFGIVIPLLTFYANEFQATPFDVGLLMSSYSLMQFVFAPVWGSLSDRFGRRPILFFTILGSSLGYLILGFSGSLAMIYVGRIIAGIAGGNLSTAQAYIADVTSKENRARGMGLFGMAFGLGFILGPAIAGILSKFGMYVPFLFAAGLSFTNAILLYFILPESRKAGAEKSDHSVKGRFADIAEILKNSRFATIAIEYFLLVMSFSMMTTSFAYYTSLKFGFGADKTGYLLGYVGFLAALMQGGIFGMLAKKFGEPAVAVAGFFLLVLSLFAVPFIGSDSGGLAGLLVGIAFFSLGNSMASPALTSLASKSAKEDEQGKTLGIMQSSASLARILGPLLCGQLLTNANSQADSGTLYRTFWTSSGIMLIALVAAIYYLAKNRRNVFA